MKKIGVTLIVLGTLLGTIGLGFALVRVIQGATDVHPVAAPQATLTLDSGQYTIYERTGREASAGAFEASGQSTPELSADEVTVTSADGSSVAVTALRSGLTETTTQGSVIYTGVARVNIPADGRYTVSIGDPAASDVIVGQSLGSIFKSLGLPSLAAILGGLLFVPGVALLIIGLVRDSKRS